MRSKTKLKRLIVAGLVLMALLMSITIFLPQSTWAWAEDEGGEPTPPTPPYALETNIDLKPNAEGIYEIRTVHEFATYMQKSYDATDGARAWHVKLMNDLDFENYEGLAAGNVNTGIIDGNGKKLKNITNTYSVYTSTECGILSHLAGNTANPGVIKNLTLENYNIIAGTGCDDVGPFVGSTQGVSIIENCHVIGDSSITVTRSADVGGIAGEFYNTSDVAIINCTSNIKIYFSGSGRGVGVGGIIGRVQQPAALANIINCKFTGQIDLIKKGTQENTAQGDTRLGGIVGLIDPTNTAAVVNIQRCVNTANLEFTDGNNVANRGGGIVGHILPGAASGTLTVNIEDCINYGDVKDAMPTNGTPNRNMGGIVGRVEGIAAVTSKISIKNCENYGQVGAETTSTFESGRNNGGAVGRVEISGNGSSFNIDSFKNYGNVFGGRWSGGVIGCNINYAVGTQNISSVVVQNSINYGNIKSVGNVAGGIVGGCHVSFGGVSSVGIENWDVETIIDNCHNYGMIGVTDDDLGTWGANAQVGGIMGYYSLSNATTAKGTKEVRKEPDNPNNTETETVPVTVNYREVLEIKNCSNNNQVVGARNSVGGILGLLEGTLAHAGINSDNLNSTHGKPTTIERRYTFANNFNTGYIEGTYDIGGIAGCLYNQTGNDTDTNGSALEVEVKNNWNTGDIHATTRTAGGIVGSFGNNIGGNSTYSNIRYKATISDNFNLAKNITAVGTSASTECYYNGAGGIAGLILSRGNTNAAPSPLVTVERNYSHVSGEINAYKGGDDPYSEYMGNGSGGIVGAFSSNENIPTGASRILIQNNYTSHSKILGAANTMYVDGTGSPNGNSIVAASNKTSANNMNETTMQSLSNMSGLSTDVFKDVDGKTPQFVNEKMPHSFYAGEPTGTASVTFNINGGEFSAKQMDTLNLAFVTENKNYVTSVNCSSVLALPVPARDRYKFLGWFTSADGGTAQKDAMMVIGTAPITLYARWQAIYVVNFDPNGGTTRTSRHFVIGDGDDLPTLAAASQTRNGYEFGWYFDDILYIAGAKFNVGELFDGNVRVSQISLKARWKTKISLNHNNDPSNPTSTTIDVFYGESFTLPDSSDSNFTNSNATSFVCWLKDGAEFTDTDPYTENGNISLTARWLVEITYNEKL